MVQTSENTAVVTEVERYHFTVEQYERMGEFGILAEDTRVELLEGEMVRMTPIGIRHADCVDELTELLMTHRGPGSRVRVQNPLRLNPHSEPQPDLMLLRGQRGTYRHRQPGPADVLLLIEVADTSAESDRGLKIPLYAQAGIPEVWLVDLTANQIELYTAPANGAYQQTQKVTRDETFTSPALPGLTVEANAILG